MNCFEKKLHSKMLLVQASWEDTVKKEILMKLSAPKSFSPQSLK